MYLKNLPKNKCAEYIEIVDIIFSFGLTYQYFLIGKKYIIWNHFAFIYYIFYTRAYYNLTKTLASKCTVEINMP